MASFKEENEEEQGPPTNSSGRTHGVYARHPLATSQYAKSAPRERDFVTTQARIYLSRPITKSEHYDQRLAPLAGALQPAKRGPYGYIDFVLQSVQHQFREKVDVQETLNDHYVGYFYGEAAEQWQFTGTFINTQQDPQFAAFFEMYHHWLRGTALADKRRLAIVEFNGFTVNGALTSLTSQLTAEIEMAMPFAFTMLVKDFKAHAEHDFTGVINSNNTVDGASAAEAAAEDDELLKAEAEARKSGMTKSQQAVDKAARARNQKQTKEILTAREKVQEASRHLDLIMSKTEGAQAVYAQKLREAEALARRSDFNPNSTEAKNVDAALKTAQTLYLSMSTAYTYAKSEYAAAKEALTLVSAQQSQGGGKPSMKRS